MHMHTHTHTPQTRLERRVGPNVCSWREKLTTHTHIHIHTHTHTHTHTHVHLRLDPNEELDQEQVVGTKNTLHTHTHAHTYTHTHAHTHTPQTRLEGRVGPSASSRHEELSVIARGLCLIHTLCFALTYKYSRVSTLSTRQRAYIYPQKSPANNLA